MATLEEVSQFTEDNIFQALEMTIFAKPVEPEDVEITYVFDESGVMVPEGYMSLGLTTESDGATWTRDTNNSEVRSHGRGGPSRRDLISDVTGLTVTAHESKKNVMELFWSQEIVEKVNAHGGIYWDKATRPKTRPVRLLGIAKDGDGPNAVYCSRWLPNGQLAEGAEQSWSVENEMAYPLNFTGLVDKQFKTAFREIWGGPGFVPASRGFTAAPPSGA